MTAVGRFGDEYPFRLECHAQEAAYMRVVFNQNDPHGFSFRPGGADDQIDDELDPLDPLVLPAGVGPKDPFGAPVVCDADAAVPTGPFAFVTDTDALLSERGHHRLLMEPTANDWVI